MAGVARGGEETRSLREDETHVVRTYFKGRRAASRNGTGGIMRGALTGPLKNQPTEPTAHWKMPVLFATPMLRGNISS